MNSSCSLPQARDPRRTPQTKFLALYQLSYTGVVFMRPGLAHPHDLRLSLRQTGPLVACSIRPTGVARVTFGEPPTPCLPLAARSAEPRLPCGGACSTGWAKVLCRPFVLSCIGQGAGVFPDALSRLALIEFVRGVTPAARIVSSDDVLHVTLANPQGPLCCLALASHLARYQPGLG